MEIQLTPDELEKVNRLRRQQESEKVDPEWYFIAEFGDFYGWGGVQAILHNEIDIYTAEALLKASRSVEAKKRYQRAEDTFIATASAKAKKPSQVFKQMTNGLKKLMKVKD